MWSWPPPTSLLSLYFYHWLSSTAFTSATAVSAAVWTHHYLLGVAAEVAATPPPLQGPSLVFRATISALSTSDSSGENENVQVLELQDWRQHRRMLDSLVIWWRGGCDIQMKESAHCQSLYQLPASPVTALCCNSGGACLSFT